MLQVGRRAGDWVARFDLLRASVLLSKQTRLPSRTVRYGKRTHACKHTRERNARTRTSHLTSCTHTRARRHCETIAFPSCSFLALHLFVLITGYVARPCCFLLLHFLSHGVAEDNSRKTKTKFLSTHQGRQI